MKKRRKGLSTRQVVLLQSMLIVDVIFVKSVQWPFYHWNWPVKTSINFHDSISFYQCPVYDSVLTLFDSQSLCLATHGKHWHLYGIYAVSNRWLHKWSVEGTFWSRNNRVLAHRQTHEQTRTHVLRNVLTLNGYHQFRKYIVCDAIFKGWETIHLLLLVIWILILYANFLFLQGHWRFCVCVFA